MHAGWATRRLPLAAAALLLVLSVITARMLLGARAELALAARATDERQQVRHLRRAMAYYLPLNPWVHRAKAALAASALQAERRGDRAAALHAWHELRSAIVRLRSVHQPFAADLAPIARHISRLSRSDPQAARALRTPAGTAALEARLQRPPEPHAGWTAVGLAGFVLWVGGAFVLLGRGLRPDASIIARRFWPLFTVVLLGLLACALGLAQA